MWDLAEKKCIWSARDDPGYCSSTSITKSVAFSPDNKCVASGGFSRKIMIWDRNTGKSIKIFEGLPDHIESVAYSPGGRYIASGGGSYITLWDLVGNKCIKTFDERTYISSIAFSPDGEHIVYGGSRIGMVDLNTGERIKDLGVACGSAIAISPDGEYLAYGCGRAVTIYDIAASSRFNTIDSYLGRISSVSFSPDGRYTVFSGQSSIINVCDAISGKSAKVLTGHVGSVNIVAFSPDGRHIASGSRDHKIKVWSFP